MAFNTDPTAAKDDAPTNVKFQEFYDNGNIRVIVNFPQGDSGPVYQYEGIIVPTNTIGGE